MAVKRLTIAVLSIIGLYIAAVIFYPNSKSYYDCEGSQKFISSEIISPASLYLSTEDFSWFIFWGSGRANLELVNKENDVSLYSYALTKNENLGYYFYPVSSKVSNGFLSKLSQKIEFRPSVGLRFTGYCSLRDNNSGPTNKP